ncbi:MAG TPA: double-strand break repair protein AddB [Rhizomicrobium sp.]|nr:double-strand break repair protein AddB [Rhizomicrobium sp.]
MSPAERTPNVLTIAASLPFAETLARGLIARLGTDPLALSSATIYLPTRRAARTFADTFARVLGGAALLPDFKALGDVDEDEFLFDADADDLDLTPAIAPIRRRLLLATLVKRWDETRRQGRLGFAQAAALAGSLASLMDEMETQGADLSHLGDLVPRTHARHWEEVLTLLQILGDHWPAQLLAEKALNPAARRNTYLHALAKRLADHPPQGLVIAAGSTGSIPATGQLLGVIARLPKGMVVLPGLDRDLDADSWNDLDPGHPQYGMKQLLERIEVKRKDVRDWSDAAPSAERELLLRETLRPAPTTDAWRKLAESGRDDIANGLKNISLLEAADPAEEASVIALALREALETKAQTAALVTPDRALARRVAANLLRWDIAIDDSAGQPLSHTPPGTFLNLLAEAAESGFAPVPLLALLKHPLATMGGDAGAFRENARKLDILLRGPRPDAGLHGIALLIKDDALRLWFKRVTDTLLPLGDVLAQREVFITDAVAAHLAAAEALSSPDTLWRGEAGEKAAELFATLKEAAGDPIPAVEASAYTPLFRDFARRIAIRPAYGKHPRLAILGAQEARLQNFDLVILGSLNEGTWPQAAATDPWFSRPMRKALKLELPEFRIGQSAHDFAVLAAGPRVMLTRALKSEGTPTIASRWVQRLVQLCNGLGLKDALKPEHDYAALSRALAEPGAPERIQRPGPTPPVKARPDKLPVTDIEKWVRDPYAIYARRILKLKPLDPLDGELGPRERGTLVHKALENFVAKFPDRLPDDAVQHLTAIATEAFAEFRIPKAEQALWSPRFLRAAIWFITEENARRARIEKSFTEVQSAEWAVTEGFTIHARADRIDVLTSGGAAILDYKTGEPPTKKQIEAFLAPQLLLEAAMLEAGAFEAVGKRSAEELLYVWFKGAREAGKMQFVDLSLVAETVARLKAFIEKFADENTPYRARIAPQTTDFVGDYDHLARVREWSLSGWEEE